jgi:hypothetical protein
LALYLWALAPILYSNFLTATRMPITAAPMIMAVATAMLQLNGRPLTSSSRAVEASGVM